MLFISNRVQSGFHSIGANRAALTIRKKLIQSCQNQSELLGNRGQSGKKTIGGYRDCSQSGAIGRQSNLVQWGNKSIGRNRVTKQSVNDITIFRHFERRGSPIPKIRWETHLKPDCPKSGLEPKNPYCIQSGNYALKLLAEIRIAIGAIGILIGPIGPD